MKQFFTLCLVALSLVPGTAFGTPLVSSDTAAPGRAFCRYLQTQIFIVDTFTQLTCALGPGGEQCLRSQAALDYLLALDARYCGA